MLRGHQNFSCEQCLPDRLARIDVMIAGEDSLHAKRVHVVRQLKLDRLAGLTCDEAGGESDRQPAQVCDHQVKDPYP